MESKELQKQIKALEVKSEYWENLKRTAEQILATQKDESLNDTKNKASLFTNELSFYQIELELQNQHLLDTKHQLLDLYTKYQALYQLSPIALFTIDKRGLIAEANDAAGHLVGIAPNVLKERGFSRYIAPDYQLVYSSYRKAILTENPPQVCELKLLRKNGPLTLVYIEGVKVLDPFTKEIQILLCVIDVSRQKQGEEKFHTSSSQVIKADRTTATDLSTIILNEINQPLGVIANYINGCIKRIERNEYKSEEILKALKSAIKQTERVADIILQMKDFKYRGNLNPETICLDSLMKEVIKLIPYEITELPVNIQYHSSPNLPKVLADKLYIQQVILHLARNAIEAMRDANINNPKIMIDVHAGGKKDIEISLIDNGPGIDENIVQKLFSAYYTTKAYGVGLGLVVCRTVVEAHGGKLSIHRYPTGGTCASFTLTISEVTDELVN